MQRKLYSMLNDITRSFQARRLNKFLYFVVVLIWFYVVYYTIRKTNYLNGSYAHWRTSRFIVGRRDDFSNVLENKQRHVQNIAVPPEGLYGKVRVLCMVLTEPPFVHENKSVPIQAINNTWGGRCNKLLFLTFSKEIHVGILNLNISHDSQFSWNAIQSAFRYIYDYEMEDADWFLKSDDKTYVILENLRQFLSDKRTEDSVYFGCESEDGQVSDRASLVLSRGALSLLVEKGFSQNSCLGPKGRDDIQLGNCLKDAGAVPGSTKNLQGRSTFHPTVPWVDLLQVYEAIFHARTPPKEADESLCSDTPITFHGLKASDIYFFDYIIYRVRVHHSK